MAGGDRRVNGWTLKALTNERVQEFPGLRSADAAKTRARDFKRWSRDPAVTFHLYDPAGQLYQYTKADGSWRLRWLWPEASSE